MDVRSRGCGNERALKEAMTKTGRGTADMGMAMDGKDLQLSQALQMIHNTGPLTARGTHGGRNQSKSVKKCLWET